MARTTPISTLKMKSAATSREEHDFSDRVLISRRNSDMEGIIRQNTRNPRRVQNIFSSIDRKKRLSNENFEWRNKSIDSKNQFVDFTSSHVQNMIDEISFQSNSDAFETSFSQHFASSTLNNKDQTDICGKETSLDNVIDRYETFANPGDSEPAKPPRPVKWTTGMPAVLNLTLRRLSMNKYDLNDVENTSFMMFPMNDGLVDEENELSTRFCGEIISDKVEDPAEGSSETHFSEETCDDNKKPLTDKFKSGRRRFDFRYPLPKLHNGPKKVRDLVQEISVKLQSSTNDNSLIKDNKSSLLRNKGGLIKQTISELITRKEDRHEKKVDDLFVDSKNFVKLAIQAIEIQALNNSLKQKENKLSNFDDESPADYSKITQALKRGHVNVRSSNAMHRTYDRFTRVLYSKIPRLVNRRFSVS